MSDKLASLVDIYAGQRHVYEQFSRNLAELMGVLIEDIKVDTLSVEWRAKDIKSFSDKINRADKQDKYEDISDITDLAGIRVITYLTGDREKIINLVKENFVIDEKNSIDKEAMLDPDRFGYQSTHLIVSYKDERTSLPEFKRFKGLKAEVQIRTVLQHTWAALDWKLRYKSQTDAPRELRRRLFRISAFLEAADDEFFFLNERLASIRNDYANALLEGDFNIDINIDSIAALFKSSNQEAVELIGQLRDLVKGIDNLEIRELSDASIQKVNSTARSYPLQTLSVMVKELKKLLRTHKKEIKEIYTNWVGSLPGGGHTNMADIVRLALVVGMLPEEAKAELKMRPFSETFNPILLKKIEKPIDEAAKE